MNQLGTERRISVLACIAEPLLQAGVLATLAAERDVDLIEATGDIDRPIDVVVADDATATRIAREGARQALGRDFQYSTILAVLAQAREQAIRERLNKSTDDAFMR